MSDETRYFTGGEEVWLAGIPIASAEKHYTEISAQDAADLLDKPEQCEQCASLIEAFGVLLSAGADIQHVAPWRSDLRGGGHCIHCKKTYSVFHIGSECFDNPDCPAVKARAALSKVKGAS